MKYKDMGNLWEEFNLKNAMAIAVTGSLSGRFDSTKDFSIVNMQNGIHGFIRASLEPSPSAAILAIKSMIGEQVGFYNAFTNPCIDDPFESKKEKILDVFNSRLKLIKDNKIHILKNRRKI